MKRIIALLLCVISTLSLVACGGENNLPQNAATDSGTKNLSENRDKSLTACFGDEVMSWSGYDEDGVNTKLTEFSIRLFEQNIKDQEDGSGNILISPTSVITALGMTTFGARGETLSQMEQMFGISRATLNAYNHQQLMNPSKELKLANSIWFTNDERLTINEIFLQFNEECYGTDVYETAFNDATVDAINEWVEQNTDGMIKDILDEIPEQAVMYLINALAFEAEWEDQYNEAQILDNFDFRTANGETQKVNMMCSDEYYYLEDDNATGFIKYYKGRKYAFVALLPNQGTTVEEYAKRLNGENLHNMLENPIETLVDAQIPQFSYEYAVQMNDILKELGIKDAFDPAKADFTNMASSTEGELFISRVLHKTFIELTAVGTKAGAATVIELEDMGYFPQEHKEVHLDRPFIYMIIDCDSNTPVFIGTVNTVEQSGSYNYVIGNKTREGWK